MNKNKFGPPTDATEAAEEELEALNAVIRALQPLSPEDRERAFRMLLAYFVIKAR